MDSKLSLVQDIPLAKPVQPLENYKQCDTRWNSFYLIIIIPIIMFIIVFFTNLILLPLFTFIPPSIILIMIPIYGLLILLFNYYLYYSRVDSIKQKCYNYGKNIIINKTN
jgi:hypothetical protein